MDHDRSEAGVPVSFVPMREIQMAVTAMERMGTGLLRLGAAAEKIAVSLEHIAASTTKFVVDHEPIEVTLFEIAKAKDEGT